MSQADNDNPNKNQSLAEIKLLVPKELQRAFQRCIWLRINESGHSQLEIMEELVRDFLAKYGC